MRKHNSGALHRFKIYRAKKVQRELRFDLFALSRSALRLLSASSVWGFALGEMNVEVNAVEPQW